ncbi:hypothetical protein [Kitasatospora sp. NPDC001132]
MDRGPGAAGSWPETTRAALAGTDAREALRDEAALLDRSAGRGPAPRPLELIEEEDSVFLVQERITGQPLGSWVAARLRHDGRPRLRPAPAPPAVRRQPSDRTDPSGTTGVSGA